MSRGTLSDPELPQGGTTGQQLEKKSNADGDVSWEDQPSAPVASVSGKTGVVVLDKGDVGLSNVDNIQQIPLSQKGSASGVATLDAASKVPTAQIPTSPQNYLGSYNIVTNTPVVINGTGTNGDYYKCSVAGTRDFGAGNVTVAEGDSLIYNGAIWEDIPSSDLVQSVAGKVGIVTLNTDDVSEGSNEYYDEAKVNANANVSANTTHKSSDGKNHSDVVLNNSHRALTSSNPHGVTKIDIVLGNVDNLQQIPITQKGSANGVATLDASSKIPASQLPASAMEYKGGYNIVTNAPTLIDGTGDLGDFYKNSVSGTRDFGSGNIIVAPGDALIYSGSIWEKIPSEDLVQSVAGKTGIVTLDTDDVSEGTNEYYTEAKVSANVSVAANTVHKTSNGADHSFIDQSVTIDSSPAFKTVKINTDAIIEAYVAGQISYDPNSLVHLLDTGIEGVRIQAGQEEYYLVYNDTSSIITNGKPCYASGVDAANNVLTVDIADNTNFLKSAQVLGLATHDIAIDSLGLVTYRGIVRDFDTTGLSFGLTYLGSEELTSTKPLYPYTRTAMGALLKSGVSDGQFQVAISMLPRRSASRSYTFTSSLAAAGIHYRAGFYHWDDTSASLSESSLTVNHGNSGVTRAGHVGIVPQAAGSVDSGQVGLRVVGTLDSEAGPQIASQTAIITEDITTLTANEMVETLEKFSGIVSIELYVVSGIPTVYSLTFNYGFSKYEDFRNIDGTVTGFNSVWEAGANDTSFDISLIYHTTTGWAFAATGFIPGNGNICNRLTDQMIDSNLVSGEEGSYKRVNLNQFINGSGKEGIIIKIETGSTNTIRSMDMHVSAFSEELF